MAFTFALKLDTNTDRAAFKKKADGKSFFKLTQAACIAQASIFKEAFVYFHYLAFVVVGQHNFGGKAMALKSTLNSREEKRQNILNPPTLAYATFIFMNKISRPLLEADEGISRVMINT